MTRRTVDYIVIGMAAITVGMIISSCKEVTVPQRVNEVSAKELVDSLRYEANQLPHVEVLPLSEIPQVDTEYNIKVIDSCEWIEIDRGFSEYYRYDLEHRPRCKYCRERNKR